MALVGDDCYFFYYSSCSKGSSCPFRHVEAALGSEVMCTHWQAGNCTRPGCKFRHFEIKVDRSSTPCYWETQPSGCTKPHCVFKHFKQQHSVNIPASKDEVPTRKPKNLVFKPGNIEVEALSQQNIDRASPKIEPVVVNPFEDDSDADSAVCSPQKKALVMRKTSPAPVIAKVPNAHTSPVRVTRKLNAGSEVATSKPASLATNKRKIKMLENPEGDAEICPRVSSSDSVLFEESRRNVVIEDDETGKSFQDILKKSKSSQGLAVKETPKIHTVAKKISVKKRLGPTESKTSPVKVSVKDRLGGQAPSEDTTLLRGDVKSRLGFLSSQSSLGLKTLAELRAQKLQIKKQLQEDSDEDSNTEQELSIKVKSLKEIRAEKAKKTELKAITDSDEDSNAEEELTIKVKSLEEIRAEKAKKAELKEKKKIDVAQEKKGWRKNIRPVLPPAKPAPKRKVITYSELFDEPEETLTVKDPVPEVKVKSLADIKLERAKRKPAVVKKERQIYMPPALKNSEIKKDTNKPAAVKRTVTPPPPDAEESKVVKKNPASVCVKTFSEIMAEKRRKQQELRAKQEAEKKTVKSKPKVSITPVIFDVDKTDGPKEGQSSQLPQNGKKTVPVVPLRNKKLTLKENVAVDNNPDEQKSSPDSRLTEGHILSDNNVCENMKSIERTVSRDDIHSSTKRLSSEAESEKTGVVSPTKRRSSSQGSDIPTKKKSRQSLNLTEDDDDFFFGTDLDDFEDGGKIDEGDLLQDIDELLA